MTIRENIETALRGGRPERTPFSCYEGLWPAGAEEIEGLGRVVVCHPVGGAQEGVETVTTEPEPGWSETVWRTPVGELTQRARTETGYGSRWTVEHFVKEPGDYEVLEWIVGNTELRLNPEAYAQADERVGDRGVVIAWMERTPLQRLWIQYTGIERLSMDLVDCPDRVNAALGAMLEKSVEQARLMAESDAEFIWLPDNVTGEVTGPPLFGEHLMPYYEQMAAILQPAGKRLVTHMDGMLAPIVDCVAQTPIDIMEAFTPPPDGNLPLDQARAAWEGKAIWINFPSSVHLAEPERIKEVTRELVAQAAPGNGFAISVTENIPASVGARSLKAIAEALAG